MPVVATRSSVETRVFGAVALIRIAGVIDESFKPPALDNLAPLLVIDLGRVESIRSFGVGNWMPMVAAKPDGVKSMWVVNAPPPIADQLGTVAGFAGRAKVLSALAPYRCSRCAASRLALLDFSAPAVREAIDAERPPDARCAVCGQVLEFAEDPIYFDYFRARSRPTPPEEVEQLLRLSRPADGQDPVRPLKLLQAHVTYYQLRGKVTQALDVRRMTSGLEGQVVFDFARVSEVTPDAEERLSALLERAAEAAEVFVSRVPQAVLEILASQRPIKLCSVLLSGRCQLCGESRPHQIAAAEHQGRMPGQAPELPCPVCGGPAQVEPRRPAEFLERHAAGQPPVFLEALQGKALARMLEEPPPARAAPPAEVPPQPPSATTAAGAAATQAISPHPAASLQPEGSLEAALTAQLAATGARGDEPRPAPRVIEPPPVPQEPVAAPQKPGRPDWVSPWPSPRSAAPPPKLVEPQAAAGPAAEAGTSPTYLRAPEPQEPVRAAPPPPLDDPLVGSMLGNYLIRRVLGEGASARVYLAEHGIIKSKVAVKLLHPRLTKDPLSVSRFIREARTVSTVIHDNVVQVLDISTSDPKHIYIIMEYLDGQTMRQVYAGRIVPYEEAAPLLLQICDALSVAHGLGVVHRDLKPENLHLLKRGERTQVKIVDFGIARREVLVEGESRTGIGAIIGTPEYMPPEQAIGTTADGRADIYSLGVIMFELATGQLPFSRPTVRALLSAQIVDPPPPPRSINPLVEPGYEAVILKALAKDPKDRFKSMAELGRAIAELQEQTRQLGSAVTPAMGTDVAAVLSQGAVPPAVRHHRRVPLALPIEVELGALAGLTEVVRERMTMLDLSEGGAFIRTRKTVPPVFTRVLVHVPEADRPLAAEVTRTTRDVDPQTQEVTVGFGVHFIAVERDPEVRAAVQALLAKAGSAPTERTALEAETEQFLGRLEAAAQDDHYALLGVPAHSGLSALRSACAQLGRVLAAPHLQGLEAEAAARVAKAGGRLEQAKAVLLDPARRAAYDAGRGNFVGVARCLESGLDAGALDRIRSQYLHARPDLKDSMRPLRQRIADLRAKGGGKELLDALVVALRVDPLDFELQEQYWEARGRLAPDPAELKAQAGQPPPDSGRQPEPH